MSGYMNSRRRVVNDIRTLFEKIVNCARDQLFVAGNRRCGNHDRVARQDLNFSMVRHRHPGQGRHWFALAAGCQNDDPVGRIIVDLGNVDQYAVRHFQVSQLHGDSHDIQHAPADYRDFPAILESGVNRLLQTVDVGRKTGNNDPVLRCPELLVKGFAHTTFAFGKARPFGIGAVGQHDQNAFVAQFGEPVKAGHLSIHRRMIDFEVAGMQNRADRCFQVNGHGIGDAVVHANKTDGE